MGAQGLSRGLDDEDLGPVWGEIERNGLVVFLDPLDGVPASVWGGGITDTLRRSLFGSRSRPQPCVILILDPSTQHTEGDPTRS